jgi:hypothetical protein
MGVRQDPSVPPEIIVEVYRFAFYGRDGVEIDTR